MNLAADFIDHLACPTCGKPVHRIGRWYVAEGEWRFERQQVSVKRPRPNRPEYDGHRWTNIPRTIDVTDRDGITTSKKQNEWHYLVEFECIGGRHDNDECCGVFQEMDCRPFQGEYEWWAGAPNKPEHRSLDVSALVDRQKLAAGDV